MRIKITQPGWARFTGLLGYTNFVDGISVEHVSKGEAQALAAVVTVEEVDEQGNGTGKNPSIAQSIIDNATMSAPVSGLTRGEEQGQARADLQNKKEDEAPTVVVAKVYTEEELAAEADKGGIKAVRVIADKFGVKGTSIAELIGKILAAQEEAAAKAKAAEEAAAVDAEKARKAAEEAAAQGGDGPGTPSGEPNTDKAAG